MKERYEKLKEDIKPFNVMNIRTLIELNDIELERDASKRDIKENPKMRTLAESLPTLQFASKSLRTIIGKKMNR